MNHGYPHNQPTWNPNVPPPNFGSMMPDMSRPPPDMSRPPPGMLPPGGVPSRQAGEPEQSSADAALQISKSTASVPAEEMFRLMTHMKEIVRTNPGEAKKMLLTNPQLCYALLQAQVVMRLVDPAVANSMLRREADERNPAQRSEPPPTFAVPAIPPPSTFSAPPPVQYSMPPPNFGGPPPPRYTAPPPPIPVAGPSAAEREQEQLLREVLLLTEEDINLLAPEEQHTVRALRNSLRGGHM